MIQRLTRQINFLGYFPAIETSFSKPGKYINVIISFYFVL